MSVATVSAVVNDSTYVSPHLKARVLAAVRELGYQPNLLARSLAKRQTRSIGVIVPDIANPFWPEVVRGAEDRAHEAGYTLLLSNSDDDPEKEAIYLNLFLAKRVDGVLLAKAPGKLSKEFVSRLKAAGTAVVQLLRTTPGFRYDAVVMDDRDAAYEGVSHLIRLGYRRIGFVEGPDTASTGQLRASGFRQALKDNKIKLDPGLFYVGDFRVKSGYNAGLVLLKRKPDAVFISNYLMAVGFLKAMRQYRMRCPQDIAIVTCDDHPWMDVFAPQLTTVNFPKYEVGSEAARVLIDRIGDRGRRPQRLELKSSLCIRESCGHALREALV